MLGWGIAGLAAVLVGPVLLGMLFPRRLSPAGAAPPGGWPKVTLVAPSRDEEVGVRGAFQSLLELTYPELEIIAVDDRSSDATGAILDELGASDPRVSVMHVTELPAGWLGKNHANHVAASASEGEWLLFTDGDIHFAPDAIERAVIHATKRGLDHVTLFPDIEPGGFWETLAISTFALLFIVRFQVWLVRTRIKWSYSGIGAFNLLRREAYDSFGGHRPLAMEVTDDIKLGKLVKANGFTQDALDGTEQLRLRWYVGLRDMAHGLTKNCFAVFDYSLLKVLLGTLLCLAFFLGPHAGVLLTEGDARVGFLVAVALLHVPYAAILWGGGRNPLLMVFLPVSVMILLYIIWRSTVITLRQGGVVWRDTFYPLADLRRGIV